jgi:F420-dependent oxidoreductase-like protein
VRLGFTVDNPNLPSEWQSLVEKVKLAEQLGFDSIWIGEAWGHEIFTRIAELVRETSRIRIGTGIVNVFSRSPAVIASSIATLDEMSGGRMLLGLGTSGGNVVEHWHGVPFQRPLRRLREYIDIINLIMRREPLRYEGELFNLQRGFRLRFTPLRPHVPIYVASITPSSIAQTGEIADGVLPVLWPDHEYGVLRRQLGLGAARSGRRAEDVAIASYITTIYVREEAQRDRARRLAASSIASYVGRMGVFYAQMLARNGYPEEVQRIKARWQDDPASAADAVSASMLDSIAMVGTPAEIHARCQRYASLGIDEAILSMPPGAPDAAGAMMETLAGR